jgi:hypothetical protein
VKEGAATRLLKDPMRRRAAVRGPWGAGARPGGLFGKVPPRWDRSIDSVTEGNQSLVPYGGG